MSRKNIICDIIETQYFPNNILNIFILILLDSINYFLMQKALKMLFSLGVLSYVDDCIWGSWLQVSRNLRFSLSPPEGTQIRTSETHQPLFLNVV